MANVLLLNPNWRELDKVGRMSKMTPGLPLELLYISGGLLKIKVDFRVLDLWLADKKLTDFSEEIKKAKIIVVNTAPSYLYWRDGTIDCNLPLRILAKIKLINSGIKTIVIGPHGTVLPETIFSKDVDYLIRGEPDMITPRVIEKVLKNKKVDLEGVLTRTKEGDGYATVTDLNSLEMPYELFNLKNYSAPDYPGNRKNIIKTYYESSRGCPFNCIFCFREGFRGKLRLKNILKIEKEIKKIKNLGVGYIYFIDECFGFNNDWTDKLFLILKKYNIEWGCQTRPTLWDKSKLLKAKESGCLSMEFGIESVNKKVLSLLDKQETNQNLLKNNIRELINLGISPGLSFILGSPGETTETIHENLKFILQFPQDKINVGYHIMLPYPKTRLWNMGIKQGLPLKSWPDMKKYAGIIGNRFSSPGQVNLQVKKVLSYLRIERTKQKLSQDLMKLRFISIIKDLAIISVSSMIVLSPKSSDLFEKMLNLFKLGRFVTNEYL